MNTSGGFFYRYRLKEVARSGRRCSRKAAYICRSEPSALQQGECKQRLVRGYYVKYRTQSQKKHSGSSKKYNISDLLRLDIQLFCNLPQVCISEQLLIRILALRDCQRCSSQFRNWGVERWQCQPHDGTHQRLGEGLSSRTLMLLVGSVFP